MVLTVDFDAVLQVLVGACVLFGCGGYLVGFAVGRKAGARTLIERARAAGIDFDAELERRRREVGSGSGSRSRSGSEGSP